MLHILIIEDERPAYEKLQYYLDDILKLNFTHDWAKSLSEATQHLESSKDYSLIIADIQLGEENVFDLLLHEVIRTPIIFCTAYNEYLSEAFETNGIAYILKPYGMDDLKKALKKYNLLFEKLKDSQEVIDRLKLALLSEQSFRTRFICKNHKNELQIVECNEVSVIEAKGDFCKIITTKGKVFTLSKLIGQVEKQINPKQFYRINRSQIVNVDGIEKMIPYSKNKLVITVSGTFDKYTTSTSRTADFRKWLAR